MNNGIPAFSRANGPELWVMLIEKVGFTDYNTINRHMLKCMDHMKLLSEETQQWLSMI